LRVGQHSLWARPGKCLHREITTKKILIWPGHHDALDFAIKFFTHGRGSHAAFLRDDLATVHEAFWPEVRDREFTEADRLAAQVFNLPGLNEKEHATFEHLFDSNLNRHIRYSVSDLFRFAFNLPVKDEQHTFCSRYVMHCLQAVLPCHRLPLTRLPDRDWASPRDLFISPRLSLCREMK